LNDQFKASRLVLESTKHYLVSGGRSPQHKICRCVNLITKLYLVPRLGMLEFHAYLYFQICYAWTTGRVSWAAQ